MLKKLLPAIGLCLSLVYGNSLWGQAKDYTFAVTSGTFTPVVTGTDVDNIEADDAFASVPIGFSFDFENAPYTTVIVSSNGWMSFANPGNSYLTNDLDNGTAAARPLVAPLWDDLAGATGSSSKATYEVTGTAPNRIFTMEWLNWEWRYNATDTVVSFQVKLYETTNEVQFIYRWENAANRNSPSASIGLSGVNTFLSVTGINTGSPTVSSTTEDAAIDSIVTGQIFTFTPPACAAPSFNQFTAVGQDSISFIWNSSGSGPWETNWGPTGFTQGSPTSNFGNSTTTAFTATGLSAGTTYDFYVRENCGVGVFSGWTGPFTMTTLCNPFTAPYSDNFDANPSGVIPLCWGNYITAPRSTPGAVLTITSGGPYSAPMHTRIYNGNANAAVDTTLLISPEFTDLTGSDKRIKFFSKASTNNTTLIIGSMSSALDASTFTAIDTITLSTSYQIFIINFDAANAYNGTDTYIGFMHGNTGTFRTIYMDDFGYEAIPSCFSPLVTSLGVSYVSDTKADAIWGNGGSGSETFIEWGFPGFFPGTGTQLGMDSVSGSIDTYTITGLQASTSYEFYVRDSCGTNGFSAWVGPFTFKTLCTPVSAPYLEGFDGTNWGPSTTFNNAGDTIDGCWTRNPAPASYAWGVRSVAPSSGGGGPSADNSGSGNYIYTEASNGGSGNVATFTSPLINVSPLTTPYIKFYYHRAGDLTEMPDLNVQVNDGTSGWVTVITLTGLDQTASTDPFKDIGADISSFGDTIQVRFRSVSKGCCQGDQAIDDFEIREAPLCPTLVGLSASALSDTSAALSWTNSPNAVNYQVWVGPAGFYQGSTTIGGGQSFTTSNPFTVDTLSASACYEFLVRAICGPGDTTVWSGPIPFSTNGGLLTLPVIEDFENGFQVFKNDCFNTTDWLPETNIVHGGLLSSKITYQNNDAAILELAGYVDLTTTTTPVLSFWHIAKLEGGFDDAYVEISTDAGNTYTAIPASAYTGNGLSYASDLLFDEDDYTIWGTGTTPAQNSWWQKETFDLSSYVTEDSVRFRFRLTSDGSVLRDGWFIDDIRIEEPTCNDPSNLGVIASSITTTSATVYFTPGGATNFDVQYGPAGFAVGSGVTVNSTNDTVVLTSLSGATCYDFYVRDSCGLGDVSSWIGAGSFTTQVSLLPFPVQEGFENGFNLFANSCNNATDWLPENTIVKQGLISAKLAYGDGEDDVLELTGYVDLTGTLNPVLSFWHIAKLEGGFDDGFVEISTDAGANYAALPASSYLGNGLSYATDLLFDEDDYTIWGTGAASAQNSWWQKEVYDLSAYSTEDSVRVRFRLNSDGSVQRDGWYIDDIRIEVPSCFDPSALGVDSLSITATSANVFFTAGGASDFNIEYGLSGFAQGSGTMLNATNDTVALTALTAGSCYEFYVRDSCGLGDVSAWIGPFSFVTGVNQINLPVSEGFENGFVTFKNACNNTTDFSIQQNIVQSGTSAAWIQYNPNDASILEMNGYIDLTTASNPELSFWHIAKLEGGFDEGYVEISIDGGLNYTPLPASSYLDTALSYATDLLFDEDDYLIWGTGNTPAINAWWVQEHFDLSAYLAQSNVRIRFRLDADGSVQRDGWYIDDVLVAEATTCASATNLAVTNLNCDAVDLNWTSDAAVTSSTIEYGLKGFAQGTGTLISGVTSPFTLSSLGLNTEYDFYVLDSCGNDPSTISGPVTFKTDSVGPVFASFTSTQSITTATDATVTFDATASTGDGLSYAWDFGNSTTGSGVLSQAIYTVNQGYSVMLTVTDRCGNTDDTTITVTVTGISIVENIYDASISMYPNPSNGNFRVNVSQGKAPYTIEVSDLSGRVIYRGESLPIGKEQNIDLGDKAPGVYMVRFSGEGLQVNQRLIIE